MNEGVCCECVEEIDSRNGAVGVNGVWDGVTGDGGWVKLKQASNSWQGGCFLVPVASEEQWKRMWAESQTAGTASVRLEGERGKQWI